MNVGAINRKRDDVTLNSGKCLETARKGRLGDIRYRFITAGSLMCLNLLSKGTFVTACEGSSLDLHSLVVELEMLLKGRLEIADR